MKTNNIKNGTCVLGKRQEAVKGNLNGIFGSKMAVGASKDRRIFPFSSYFLTICGKTEKSGSVSQGK
jgi:hypothetical protein